MSPPSRLAAFLFLCVASGASLATQVTAQVMLPSGEPLEDAAVVLEALDPASVPRGARSAAIEQRDREFVPYFTIVQKGTRVEFPNRDQVKHHVYSFSPAKIFEIKLYAGKSNPVVMDRIGEVALGCNIHDWMEAYVLVVDTPYFAKSNPKGEVALPDVPAGQYRMQLWHPRQKTPAPTQVIKLGAGTTHLDLTLDVLPRVRKHKPGADLSHY
jgi:plastocyanin